ncbi:MAG: folate-binding protein YgfZ [Bryobacterales bacterium]|nr:folate-binding protein YgfZ [Bryobacterales bacterium]
MHLDAYEALRNRAALIPLDGRGLIRVSDEDRMRLLHAMCTNAIEQLKPGEGTKALFLNDKGRILAEISVLCRHDDLLLDTEAATRQAAYDHLDHYIIMDVVELEDLSDTWHALAVEGPAAAELLSAMGANLPEAEFAHREWDGALLAKVSYTGSPGYRLYVPAEFAGTWRERLAATGLANCDMATAEVVRLEYGRTRHGVEYGPQHLVHEAQLLDHVSFSKGCYLGQEIVERVRSRGNVNRLLVRLVVDTTEVPSLETPVMAGGAEGGKVLSAALSPALGKVIAWALLRAEHVHAGLGLAIGGASASLAPAGRLA